jgi:hypothetical protein
MRFVGPDEVRISINIELDGHEVRHNHMIDRIAWERASPPRRAPMDQMDAYDAMQRAEERKRLIDMLSSKIAYSLVNAIADKYAKDNT